MADEPQLPLEQPPANSGNPAAAAPAASIALSALTEAGIPDTYIKDGAFDAKSVAASLTELGTLKTAAEERAKLVPTDGKYDFGLPKDWKAPEGLELPAGFTDTWKVSDAKVERFAAFAKAEGLSQAKVSQFVSDWASADAAEKFAAGKADADAAKTADDATKADAVKVLGANYGTVVETTRNAWQALLVEKLGKEVGEQLAKDTGFQSASNIKALGDLINALNTKLASHAPAGGANSNSAAVALVGTPDGGRRLLDMANAKASN